MPCKICGKTGPTFCSKCAQRVKISKKYPFLSKSLTAESFAKVNDISGQDVVQAICSICGKISDLKLESLIRVHKRKGGRHVCHRCRGQAGAKAGIDLALSVVNMELTLERHGSLGKNANECMVVVVCKQCGRSFDVRLRSVSQQARRHRAAGKDFMYNCFECGMKRHGVVES
jgi:hypothetical protein